MPAQPFGATVEDKETLKLLIDNIHNLYHPRGWIKHPYFQERFSRDPAAIDELKKIFCEGIVLLLEKHDRLKAPRKRTANKQ